MNVFSGASGDSSHMRDSRSFCDRVIDEFYSRLVWAAGPIGLVVLTVAGLAVLINNRDWTAFDPRGATFKR